MEAAGLVHPRKKSPRGVGPLLEGFQSPPDPKITMTPRCLRPLFERSRARIPQKRSFWDPPRRGPGRPLFDRSRAGLGRTCPGKAKKRDETAMFEMHAERFWPVWPEPLWTPYLEVPQIHGSGVLDPFPLYKEGPSQVGHPQYLWIPLIQGRDTGPGTQDPGYLDP